jgi:hypothetical protein
LTGGGGRRRGGWEAFEVGVVGICYEEDCEDDAEDGELFSVV